MQDDNGADSVTTAADDLVRLANASDGASDSGLEVSAGLEVLVLEELDVAAPVTKGVRIALLRAALTQTIAHARKQALEVFEEYRTRQSTMIGSFQVAAAGELLGVTDEREFLAIRDERCDYLETTWADLIERDEHKGPVGRRRLRAALWIGLKSGRTVEKRHQPVLLRELEAALKAYASSKAGREQLQALIPADGPAPEDLLTEQPQPEPPPPESRRWLWVSLVIALIVVVAGLLAGLVFWPDDDRPTTQPSSSPGNSSGATSGVPTGRTLEEVVERCTTLPPDSELAKQLRAKNQAIVDGRCDNDPDAPVGAYIRAVQTGRAVQRLSTGDVISNICRAETTVPLKDKDGHASSTWVGFDAAAGNRAYVPAIWTQGEEGAKKC